MITASRIGKSALTLDWSGIAAVSSRGAGPGYEILEADIAWNQLKSRFDSGEIGFFNAPVDDAISQLSRSVQLAMKFKEPGKFRDCLFLGIGGSALGPIVLLESLGLKADPSIRFHFIENVDPIEWKRVLSRLSPEHTLVCCVAKSGSTFETLSQLMIALEWLGHARWKSNIVVITDPEKGDLRKWANAETIETLAIHPSIGGRFSVFSPVGFFAGALAGLNMTELNEGAKLARTAFTDQPLEKNPIAILASELLRHGGKRPIHVCLPYSTPLRKLGLWFVQLWAESLGKDGKGFTPLAALGTTDQHSILQLLRDGPDDKVTWFFKVDRYQDPVEIPKAPTAHGAVLPAFQLLEGSSLADLLEVEYLATAKVLLKQNRPTLTFKLDQLDEKNLGACLFSLCILTALTGTMMQINPFDQPGVEEGKVYIRESLLAARGTKRELNGNPDVRS